MFIVGLRRAFNINFRREGVWGAATSQRRGLGDSSPPPPPPEEGGRGSGGQRGAAAPTGEGEIKHTLCPWPEPRYGITVAQFPV